MGINNATMVSVSGSGFDESLLKPFSVFGGATAVDLFPTNNLVMIAWACLLFLPRWRWTPTITLGSAILHFLIFLGTTISTLTSGEEQSEVEFGSLKGVYTLMSDPTNSFAIWMHMGIFHLLVVRMMVLDSVEKKASNIFHCLGMVPVILMTFIMGPVGVLHYLGLRAAFLDATTDSEKTKTL